MRRRLLFLVLCSCAVPMTAAFALPNVIVNDRTGDPALQTQTGPQVATLGAHAIAVWTDRPGADFFQYAFSVDGGATFVDAGAPPAPAGWSWRIDPRVVMNPADGAVYLCGQIVRSGRWGVGFVAGTFSSGSIVWGTPVVVEDLPSGPSLTIGNLAMAEDAAHGRVVVAYSSYPAAPIGTYVRYSDDGGGSWSAAIALDGPNPVGPGAVEVSARASGDVLVSWADSPAGVDERKVRAWSSGDPGFGPAATVSTAPILQMELPPGASWQGEVGGWPYVSQATDQSTGPHRGRTYMAWSEPFHVFAAAFPPITDPGIERFVESEPNDTAYVVPGGLSPGAILRGAAGSVSPLDADWYVFKLHTGERIVIWPDSLPPGWPYDLRVIAPDAVGRLIGSVRNADGAGVGEKTGFVAPVTGNYFVRFSPWSTAAITPVGYRIRTAAFSAGPEVPLDQGDVIVTWSDDGTTWSAPARANHDPIGFDAYHVEVAAGYDGTPYLTWYDYSQSAYGALSHRVVARSLDGGASWGLPENLSDESTDWTAVVHTHLSTKMGYEAGISADPLGVRAVWTDGRNGDPDIYTTRMATGLALADCPVNALTAHPGDVLPIVFQVTNENPLFGNTVHYRITNERGWPQTEYDTPLSAGATTNLGPSIVVPDTAATGILQACIQVDIAGASPASCCFSIKITGTTAVDAGVLPGLQLQARPNPASGSSALAFNLPSAGPTRLAIIGVGGNRIRVLSEGVLAAGIHSLTWDGRDALGQPVPPGVYFARLEWEGRSRVIRMVRIE